MSKELQFPDPAPDREVAGALRPLLVPPVDDAVYWAGLQRRIMARVAAAGSPQQMWWMVSPGMARAGLLAAAIALLVLGALAQQTRDLRARMAYQSVTDTELEVAKLIRGIDEPYGAARAPAPAPQR